MCKQPVEKRAKKRHQKIKLKKWFFQKQKTKKNPSKNMLWIGFTNGCDDDEQTTTMNNDVRVLPKQKKIPEIRLPPNEAEN